MGERALRRQQKFGAYAIGQHLLSDFSRNAARSTHSIGGQVPNIDLLYDSLSGATETKYVSGPQGNAHISSGLLARPRRKHQHITRIQFASESIFPRPFPMLLKKANR